MTASQIKGVSNAPEALCDSRTHLRRPRSDTDQGQLGLSMPSPREDNPDTSPSRTKRPRAQVAGQCGGSGRASAGGTRSARVLGCLRPPWCAVAPLVGPPPPAPGPAGGPPLLAPALCASHSAAGGGPTRPGLVVAGLRPAIGRPFAKGGFLQSSPAANLRKKRPFAKLAWGWLALALGCGLALRGSRGFRSAGPPWCPPVGRARRSPSGYCLLASQYITHGHGIKAKPPMAVLRSLDTAPLCDAMIMPARQRR